MIIEARKEDITSPAVKPIIFFGKINYQREAMTYGKFEIRAKMPIGKGMAGNLMMPEDEPSTEHGPNAVRLILWSF